MRSSNPFNVVYATLDALKELRTKEEVAKIRNKEAAQI
jgi:small subunit ribosomal protein S5